MYKGILYLDVYNDVYRYIYMYVFLMKKPKLLDVEEFLRVISNRPFLRLVEEKHQYVSYYFTGRGSGAMTGCHQVPLRVVPHQVVPHSLHWG